MHGERRGIRKLSLVGYALIATLFPRKDDLAQMEHKTVCVVGLGYVKLFCKQKHLLKMLTLSAAETVGKNLKRGATVVLESTVYPGVTEEIVKHVLERESKMNCSIALMNLFI